MIIVPSVASSNPDRDKELACSKSSLCDVEPEEKENDEVHVGVVFHDLIVIEVE